MSIWDRIKLVLDGLASGASLSEIFSGLTKPPERTVAFTIAVIALGAKMAKADGRVTRDEVAAFREVFHISTGDEKNAARIYNLARTDTLGFEEYAKKIASMFEANADTLHDLLEGLFHIAAADGLYHPGEDAFLREVATIFGLSDRDYYVIKSRFSVTHESDHFAVLGVSPTDDFDTIRQKWAKLVRDNHPDLMLARGVPEEAVNLATKRLAAINTAWEQIKSMHEPA